MNKKHFAYKTLLIILFINQSSFAMQSPLAQAIALSTAFYALSYGLVKGSTLLLTYTKEDATQNVQAWARDILTKKNITNANSVPLKLGNGWLVGGGTFIQIDKEEAKNLEKNLAQKQITSNMEKKIILADAEGKLLHEAKHYHNSDTDKGFLTSIISSIPLCYYYISSLSTKNIGSSAKKISYGKNILNFLTLAALPIISANAYIRYQETEADRFAFMNLSSIEKLEIYKNLYLQKAELFEENLEFRPIGNNRSWLKNIIRPALSIKIVNLNQELSKNSPKNLKQLLMQKKILIDIAYFIDDFRHPSFQSRADLAEKCLEKRRHMIESPQ